MLKTYPAILRGNRLEWSEAEHPNLPPDAAVRVHVTLLDWLSAKPAEQGQQMAAALESLAASRILADIADADEWERWVREDRQLPS